VKLTIAWGRDGNGGQRAIGVGLLATVAGAVIALAGAAGALTQAYLTSEPPATITVSSTDTPESARAAAAARQSVTMLSERLGALQARMTGIETLGRRVAEAAGVEYTDPAVQGGLAGAAAIVSEGAAPGEGTLSAEALGRELDEMLIGLSGETDRMTVYDLALTHRSAEVARLPTTMPVTDFPYLTSSYGWRQHPLTGRYTVHEGLDFSAPPGTPILAAAGGVVVESSFHPSYGNMVEIDHGDGLMTRYAHAQALLVKRGDLIERGQLVARVGSTGRSTGPHLHFEVRLAGQALDPKLFLGAPRSAPPQLAEASASARSPR
jgi:murein DD-endopeptidase MepM/ murein hydrolase activator NlpD